MKLYEIPACTRIINVWGTEILPDIGLFHFSATPVYSDRPRRVLRSIPYKLTRNKKLHVNGLLKINKEME